MTGKACVVGSGPNGLAAAIRLAQAGLAVDVFEAQPTIGGGARTLELTMPGFRHDVGSAVHPLGAGSPFFNSLPLHHYGLEWIHSPAVLAHPFDDCTAVTLERDVDHAQSALGIDAPAWREMVEPFATQWSSFAAAALRPISTFPPSALLMARFGLRTFVPALSFVNRFRSPRTRALFAGLAAHSFLSLTDRLSTAFGLILAIAGHAVGWPIPRGGAQSITDVLCQHVSKLGARIFPSMPVDDVTRLDSYDLTLCDLTPRQVLAMANNKLSSSYKSALHNFRYGPGVFKVDYALRAPIPWKAPECQRAATVHLGGSAEEIAAAEEAVCNQQHPERPFVLLSQPTLFDSSRAPSGKHVVWCYCHVPNSSSVDMLERIESQIERFAPGFRDCVLARNISSPALLEKTNANLVGGDISGGAVSLRQFVFRPTWRQYATSAPGLYICSSSTPPGAGVHGMCGYHAARIALASLEPRRKGNGATSTRL